MARLEDYGDALRFPRDEPGDYKGVMEFRRITVAPPEIEVGNLADFVGRWLSVSLDDAQGELNTPGGGEPNVVQARRVHTNSYPNVTLYLPNAIQLTDGVIYDNTVQLGIAGAVAERALNNGGSAMTAINQAIGSGVSAFTDLFRNAATPDMARLAIARAAQEGPVPQVAADVVGAVLRTAVNPNRRTLFRAVIPREFSFAFKLVASSPREAEEIDKIINFFRVEMYPEGIGEDLSVGYTYPNMFDIRMKYADKRVGYKFLPCYLSSLQTVINPSSMSFHKDGKPSEIDVTMTFLEERNMIRQDILEGR